MTLPTWFGTPAKTATDAPSAAGLGQQGSIARRLSRQVASIYLVVLITVLSAVAALQYQHVRAGIDEELTSLHRTYGVGIGHALWSLDEEQLDAILAGLMHLPSVVRVTLLSPDGIPVRTLDKRADRRHAIQSSGSFAQRAAILPRQADGRGPLGWLEIHSDPSVVIQRMKPMLAYLAIAALVQTLLLLVLVKSSFNRILTGPLMEIARCASSIDAKSVRGPVLMAARERADELGVIAGAIDSLAEALCSAISELGERNMMLEGRLTQQEQELTELRAESEHRQACLFVEVARREGKERELLLANEQLLLAQRQRPAA